MKILQIASGSKGNCTYLEANNTKILIDCGISKKRIVESLDNYNHNLEDIDAVLITHEHTDHISGLVPVYNASKAIFYMTEGTYKALPSKARDTIDLERLVIINYDSSYQISGLAVETVEISHDASEPVGYIIHGDLKKVVYITDTGYIHQSLVNKLKDADLYILESNHDPELLMESDRPYPTKIRILGDKGHLSNEDSAYIASKLVSSNTKYILLAHLSEECNLPEVALNTYSKIFREENIPTDNLKLITCSQIPTGEIKL